MKSFFKTDTHFENPFFVGTVEDNNDPTSNYRVKVRIPIIHPDTITTEQLPWAAKVDSSFMGMDSSSISHSIPEVGSKVLVLAVGNNINSLIYLGCLYKKTDSTPSGDDYLNCYGIYDKNGNYIKLDKIKKLFELIWEGTINIDKVKELTVGVKGNITINAESDITISAKKNINIKASSDLTINADSSVNVKTTGPATLSATMTVIKDGPVTIQQAETCGFNCLTNCLLTGAQHVSPTTI